MLRLVGDDVEAVSCGKGADDCFRLAPFVLESVNNPHQFRASRSRFKRDWYTARFKFLIIYKGSVTIDGATHGCSSGPCVEITGSEGALGFKLTIKTGNSVVRGMIFNGCGFACVSL